MVKVISYKDNPNQSVRDMFFGEPRPSGHVKHGRGGRRNRKLRREGRKIAKWHFVTQAEQSRYLRRGNP
jgi:hypothetical protein